MKRVVLDTNVIVSGMIKAEGIPGQIMRAWRENKFILLLSPPIFEEIGRVIRQPKVVKYHKLKEEEIQDFLLDLYSASEETEEKIKVNVTKDPTDNLFLACAKEGKADYIVTGDKDFLKLEEYEGIKIINPAQFLKRERF